MGSQVFGLTSNPAGGADNYPNGFLGNQRILITADTYLTDIFGWVRSENITGAAFRFYVDAGDATSSDDSAPSRLYYSPSDISLTSTSDTAYHQVIASPIFIPAGTYIWVGMVDVSGDCRFIYAGGATGSRIYDARYGGGPVPPDNPVPNGDMSFYDGDRYGIWVEGEPTLGGGVELVVANMSVATVADNVALIQQHTLAVTDCSVATLMDNVGLVQQSTLSVNNMASATTMDNVSLVQQHVLAVADMLSSVSMDNVSLVQAHVLAVNSMSSSTVFENVVLSLGNVSLSVDDVNVAAAMESPVLIQAGILSVADMISQVSMDNVALIQQHVLSVGNMSIATFMDNVSLTQQHTLAVNNIAVGVTADNVTLSSGGFLSVEDMLSITTMNNVALTQASVLTVNSMNVQSVMDGLVLSQDYVLSVADMLVQSSASSPVLEVGIVLQIQDALVAALMENPSLLQQHLLIVDNMNVASTFQHVQLSGGYFTGEHLLLVTETVTVMVVDITESVVIVADDINLMTN